MTTARLGFELLCLLFRRCSVQSGARRKRLGSDCSSVHQVLCRTESETVPYVTECVRVYHRCFHRDCPHPAPRALCVCVSAVFKVHESVLISWRISISRVRFSFRLHRLKEQFMYSVHVHFCSAVYWVGRKLVWCELGVAGPQGARPESYLAF